MDKRARRLLQGGIATMLMLSGSSFAGIPDHEVSYTYSPPSRLCQPYGDCFVTYEVELGNTGWENLESVEIVVDSELLKNLVQEPRVKTISGKRRDMFLEDEGSMTRIRIPDIERGRTILLQFMRQEQWSAEHLSLGDYVRDVRPAKGVAVHYAPKALNFARFWFRILAV